MKELWRLTIARVFGAARMEPTSDLTPERGKEVLADALRKFPTWQDALVGKDAEIDRLRAAHASVVETLNRVADERRAFCDERNEARDENDRLRTVVERLTDSCREWDRRYNEMLARTVSDEKYEEARAEVGRLKDDAEGLAVALKLAVYLAEHLWQMIPQEVWREHGADDGQGHYEGDYHAEQVKDELAALHQHNAFEKKPVVLGRCAHGVDLDREFCPEGCRV
jgi:hypothetical protein